ncbi:MAG: GNAT family N-acetyltransferase [Candidatus Njordarchaeum guaymaensis]
MALEIIDISIKNFEKIPKPCKYCLYWQTCGPFSPSSISPEMKYKKREWIIRTLDDFGKCGYIILFDGSSVGFVQYAPARFFPRIRDYKSETLDEGAIFIACLYIVERRLRRKGFGSVILKHLIKDLRARGFKAIETFARKKSEENPSGPLEFYLKYGFKIKEDINDFPLVRLEL